MSQAHIFEAEQRCPYHAGIDERKSAAAALADESRAKKLANGGLKIKSFALTRKILRSGGTRQAGFMADLVIAATAKGNTPILYQEGEVHMKQRTASARFFAPRVVATRYRDLMNEISDRLIDRLKTKGRADLSQLGIEMAIAVAAEIVGLTDSSLTGMARRLNSFFTRGAKAKSNLTIQKLIQSVNRLSLLSFFWFDVKPAIKSRKKERKDDVISHLIDHNYTDAEILTECMTYGAAGMVTTREFIVMAAWHLIERDELRKHFVETDEDGRIAILEEILRLEPVVGALYRRASEDLTFDMDGEITHIPAGTLVEMDVRATNSDPETAGECPYRLMPERDAAKASMSFGDGNHRCPGSAIAMQETAIFLEKLFKTPNLKLTKGPVLAWNALTVGYELRDAILTVG